MTLDLSLRREFASQFGDAEVQDLSELHPDCRMVQCPEDLILPEEWESREGRGYVLGNGAWYDPVDDKFYGFA